MAVVLQGDKSRCVHSQKSRRQINADILLTFFVLVRIPAHEMVQPKFRVSLPQLNFPGDAHIDVPRRVSPT